MKANLLRLTWMTTERVTILYNFYGYYRGAMAGSVFDRLGISPTISTMCGGNREPMVFVYDEI